MNEAFKPLPNFRSLGVHMSSWVHESMCPLRCMSKWSDPMRLSPGYPIPWLTWERLTSHSDFPSPFLDWRLFHHKVWPLSNNSNIHNRQHSVIRYALVESTHSPPTPNISNIEIVNMGIHNIVPGWPQLQSFPNISISNRGILYTKQITRVLLISQIMSESSKDCMKAEKY